MRRRIVPVFLPNRGCPQQCVFCNERITAGIHPEEVTRKDFENAIALYLGASFQQPAQTAQKNIEARRTPHMNLLGQFAQIAFYGGNFTGIDIEEQTDLLQLAQAFVDEGVIVSIRISTRPDFIDQTRLGLLKQFSVKTVEIGVQSMVDTVLARCRRGHTADDSEQAIELLKANGFETGVHLMAGLPGENRSDFEYTIERIVALKPDTVRIHPTVVFRDTELASMFRSGQYQPLDLEKAIDYCRYALTRFRAAGIEVIRMGLQTTTEMEEIGAVIAGPFHPAFRSLVEGAIFLDQADRLLTASDIRRIMDADISFHVSPQDLSDFRGIGNRNMAALRQRYGGEFYVLPDLGLKRGEIILETGGKRYRMNHLLRHFDQGEKS